MLMSTWAQQYKIELRSRNHNTLTRQQLIDTIAACVPPEFTVDLEDPKVFVLVEVFKVRYQPFSPAEERVADECHRGGMALSAVERMRDQHR